MQLKLRWFSTAELVGVEKSEQCLVTFEGVELMDMDIVNQLPALRTGIVVNQLSIVSQPGVDNSSELNKFK